MPPPDPKKVRALQLNLAGVFSLLGGSSDDKQRFYEIIKLTTTPAEARLINAQIDVLAAQAKAIQAGAKALQGSAQQLAKQ